jgi:membrane protein implicated in regulation of membrane protease activity
MGIAAAWAAFKGSKFMGYAIAVFAAVAAVLIVIARAFSAGKASEKGERAKADQVVRDRVDAVRPPEAGETEKSLREGQF